MASTHTSIALPLFRLFLSTVATRGRLIVLGLLAAIGPAIGIAINRGTSTSRERTEAWAVVASNYGMTLLAGVGSLMVAAAVLGTLAEDSTLVYVWLRPIARWKLAVVAWLAAVAIVLPLATTSLLFGGALAGATANATMGGVAGVVLAVSAYGAMFTWLGLRTKRPLSWGLGYVLVWEGFVARAGSGAARLAVASYTRSILARAADVELRLADRAQWTSVVIPLVVTALGLALATRRLARADVA